MSAQGAIVLLADRLASAYDIDPGKTCRALTESAPPLEDADLEHLAIERDGESVLLIQDGEILARLDLSEVLGITTRAQDTLDPYGDGEDVLSLPLVHTPFEPRIPPSVTSDRKSA
ncbi:hypothetical protein [Sphingomonas sp. 3-13AW]|uniref:hypothetical protein n=1 Tax=Sphingomonas sp. 3-13AW TaxID=3050450 RepID=UPI003BB77D94